MIDPIYLPHDRDELRQHFTADADANIDYFERSASRYRSFLKEHSPTIGQPLTAARGPRQIEKDERFWTAAALKAVFDSSKRPEALANLMRTAFGPRPTLTTFATWQDCLEGELRLYFEAHFPSPRLYAEWLRENLKHQQVIPYVLDAAERTSRRRLEGATHVDGVLVNLTNGFGVVIEAKVLSDISYGVSFDMYRNQLARNIDVMLEEYPDLDNMLSKRKADRSLFVLLTPRPFRDRPHSRLYGWLLHEYQTQPEALRRDLPHRAGVAWEPVARRIGWLTFEDIREQCDTACAWLVVPGVDAS
jgi:hypothetical protein